MYDDIKYIPYGISDFSDMREKNGYYVDKTSYIPMIERAPSYLFCLRPRRAGKSLFLSMLQHYYDINMAERFDELFGDTYIGQHPTPKQNSYLTMLFNFSVVSAEKDKVRDSFEDVINNTLNKFIDRYERIFTSNELVYIREARTFTSKMQRLFDKTHPKGLKTYVFIDEYDNFTNTILTSQGVHPYHDMTHDDGFYRYFFNVLKGSTGGMISGLTRLFITGVAPITMDDVTSGFNIGSNISLTRRFNEMIGFTEDEVYQMLTYYQERALLLLPIDETFALMKVWYNNYRFSRTAKTSMFNSDMVLYFLDAIAGEEELPEHLIDNNIRTDYGKLRYLMTVDSQISSYLKEQKEKKVQKAGQQTESTQPLSADEEQSKSQPESQEIGQPEHHGETDSTELNGNFSVLQQILEDGEIISPVNDSFPVRKLLDEQNFTSLLCYLGLLTFGGTVHGLPLLKIPNRTVKDLLYGYLRDGFQDADIFKLNIARFSTLLGDMAYLGAWCPLFDYINNEIQKQASVRDHLNGEKVVQGFLLAYLNITHHFLTWSENETNGGFVDLYLEPFVARFPDMKYGYLIELKYLSQKDASGKKGKENLQKKIDEAHSQLIRYANDE
ncbi:MAG: AAA family ATPase, partial [Chloroflexota bacterium]